MKRKKSFEREFSTRRDKRKCSALETKTSWDEEKTERRACAKSIGAILCSEAEKRKGTNFLTYAAATFFFCFSLPWKTPTSLRRTSLASRKVRCPARGAGGRKSVARVARELFEAEKTLLREELERLEGLFAFRECLSVKLKLQCFHLSDARAPRAT